jgi:hypothetical protein
MKNQIASIAGYKLLSNLSDQSLFHSPKQQTLCYLGVDFHLRAIGVWAFPGSMYDYFFSQKQTDTPAKLRKDTSLSAPNLPESKVLVLLFVLLLSACSAAFVIVWKRCLLGS